MHLVNLIGKLPVHPDPDKKYDTRDVKIIEYLVLHHTAGLDNPLTTVVEHEEQTPEQIARFHVESDRLYVGGAPGIGYHYLTDNHGIAYKCWPVTTIAACVKRMNSKCLCVCMIGNRSLKAPSPEQWECTVELAVEILSAYPWLKIIGHREAPTTKDATSCPGTLVSMDLFRADVQKEVRL